MKKINQIMQAYSRLFLTKVLGATDTSKELKHLQMCNNCNFVRQTIVKQKICGDCGCPISAKIYASCPKGYFDKESINEDLYIKEGFNNPEEDK